MWYRLRRLMNATIGVEDVSSDLRFGGIKNPGMSSTPQDGGFGFSHLISYSGHSRPRM